MPLNYKKGKEEGKLKVLEVKEGTAMISLDVEEGITPVAEIVNLHVAAAAMADAQQVVDNFRAILQAVTEFSARPPAVPNEPPLKLHPLDDATDVDDGGPPDRPGGEE